MAQTKSTKDPLVEQFWIAYFETIRLFRIPENAFSWYQKHVEAFIQFLPAIRLLNRSPEHIEQWFTHIGRISDLEDWQFRQREQFGDTHLLNNFFFNHWVSLIVTQLLVKPLKL